MNKKFILDSLGRRDFLAGLKSGELGFVHTLFEKISERDYEGMAEVARAQGLDLEPVYLVMEELALKNLNSPRPLNIYQFFAFERLITGPPAETGAEPSQSRPNEIEPGKLRELYFLLEGDRFGEQQVEKIRYYLTVWALRELSQFIWEKGLLTYFNKRYNQLSGEKSEKLLPLEEIVRKADVAEILEKDKLIDDFVFDEAGPAGSAEGLKEDLHKEKTSREKAAGLLDELFELFHQEPLDLSRIRFTMAQLHMARRIEMLERAGVAYLRQYVKDNFIEGAREAAGRFGFAFPDDPGSLDPARAAVQLNQSFLDQVKINEQSRRFLRWEALLSHELILNAAHCFTLDTTYLILAVSPVEEVEHYLFGCYPTFRDKHNFLVHFLTFYFRNGRLGRTAAELIKHYLDTFKGQIRLRNAFRIAVFSFPVVITVAILVGWVYHLTVGGLGEGTLLAVIITVIGETIAARNGYSQRINPDDQEMIPEYAIRDQGVLKIKPLSGAGTSGGAEK